MVSRIETGTAIVGQNSYPTATTGVSQPRKRFDQNYGAMNIILRYLPQIEQIQLQGLSMWWYITGVARTQVHFELSKMFFFFDRSP